MSPATVTVPWGREELTLTLPANWKLVGVLRPQGRPPVEDIGVELDRALAAPIGSPSLRAMAAGAQQVVIVVDDLSRPTPAALFLPRLLAELNAAGVADSQITLLPALGVHRGMTESEMAAKVGAEALRRLRWVNHAFDDPGALTYLGRTSCGTPAYVNTLAAQADLIVSVGCIEPHVIASFGGGYKNLFPGIAGQQTVAANHALNCRPSTFNMVGQPPEKNPMRLDLEECGKLLKKPVFVANVILNSDMRPVRIAAGDPIAAHREGCRVCAEMYGVQIPGPADVVIANSFPMETDLRQGFKALANTIRATKPGGVMFSLIRAEEGLGAMNVPSKRIPLGKGAMRMIAGLLLPVFGRIRLKGMRDDDKFFVYFALQTLKRYNVVFYAPNVPAELGQRVPFLDFNADMSVAMSKAVAAAPREASVLVFPNGGVTYPILLR
jgi:nickel-dependent lactate racemase